MTRKPKIKEYGNSFNDGTHEALEMQEYINAFQELGGTSIDNISRQGSVFHRAVISFGFDKAMKAFQNRFPEQSPHNWEMLDAIGSESCDPRVFFLPRHMHTMRYLDKREQKNLFDVRRITVIRSRDGKESVADIGTMKSCDWAILFDKDRKKLRTPFEMKEFVKKRNEERVIRDRIRPKWKFSKRGLELRGDVHLITAEELRQIIAEFETQD